MEYIKENPIIIDKTDKEKRSQLIESILSTRDELNKAHINFEYADFGLIDFYAYQIMALQCKLDYLTRIAKSKNVVLKLPYKKVI